MELRSLPQACFVAGGKTPQLRDLPVVLKLKFQFLDQLGEALPRDGIRGFQRQSVGLGQLSVEFFAVSAVH
jgi:hypothetical protein